ncbi:nSTAND1 domain-containing NTPase [Streptomyces sp. 8N616]|uniref:nSTAND1 domain-containing NTPase n=1 Tax=Streptomyces sp. 8N616 TaxID=3457414 RepID=UPI003FD6A59E
MPRGERPLDAGDSAVLRFAADLRRLRRKAGSPTYRVLAERAHYAVATLSEAAGGRKLPSLAVALAYVRACGGDADAWERRWHSVAAELAAEAASDEPHEASGDVAPPYVGLAAFRAEDAELFFGRERLVEELLARLSRGRFTAVFGASGAGKSSLLRAGLLPRWQDESKARRVVLFTPGPHPLEECAIHLARVTGGAAGALRAELAADRRTAHRAVRQALAAEPDEAELLLVVDQFEEVFTLCRDPAEREQFLGTLLAAVQAENSRCRVVLGVRADFYAHCTAYPELIAALADTQVAVGPMTTDELRQAITRPAVRGGWALEGALLADLIAHANGQVGVLPLLSHALLETWRRRRGNTLTLAGFQAAGGMDGALARTAEALYSELQPHQQRVAKHLFLRLIALGEGTEDTKRRIRRSELVAADDPDTTTVLERLAGARLLTLDRDSVEIAHEALIRSWPRLHDWVAEDREGLRIHRRLTEATEAWQSVDHDPGALYRGTRLALARDWSSAGDRALTVSEREFLDVSAAAEAAEHAASRRRARRGRQFVAALVALLVLAVGAGGFAYQQRSAALEQRRVALSRGMAAQSAATATGQPEAAMLLAREALRTAPTAEARGALLSTQAEYFDGRLTGHADSVNAVAFSPDGKLLATGSSDHTVKLWNAADHRLLATLRGHTDLVLSVAFSPDGKLLATGSNDRSVKLWDVADRRTVATLPGGALGVAFSPDGEQLASVSSRARVKLWDVDDRRMVAALRGHGDDVNAVAFSPDGKLLATGSNDRSVKLWDVEDRRTVATLRGHSDNVDAVAFSPDGELLATGSADRSVKLWDVDDRKTLATLREHSDGVNDVGFSPDGRTVASAGGDGAANLWDVAGRRLITSLSGHTDYVLEVAFSSRGNSLATAGFDRTTALWDLDRSALITHPVTEISSVALSPDGRLLATGGADHRVRIWDVGDRRQIATLTGHTGPVTAVAFSPDGKLLASGGADHRARVWDVAGRRQTATLTGHTGAVMSVAFTPDGRLLATGSDDWTAKLWEVAGRRDVATLTEHTDFVNGVAFSPDGRTVATASDDGTVKLWGVTGHREIATLTGHTGSVQGVAFSPDGNALASSGNDGTVRLWDAAAHRPTATLAGHTGSVRSVAFSPNGRTLASSGNDRTVKVWDAAARREIATLTGHDDTVWGVRFGPDGKALASGSSDGTTRLWDLDLRHRTTQVCRTIGTVSPAQWARLIPDLPYRPRCGDT